MRQSAPQLPLAAPNRQLHPRRLLVCTLVPVDPARQRTRRWCSWFVCASSVPSVTNPLASTLRPPANVVTEADVAILAERIRSTRTVEQLLTLSTTLGVGVPPTSARSPAVLANAVATSLLMPESSAI